MKIHKTENGYKVVNGDLTLWFDEVKVECQFKVNIVELKNHGRLSAHFWDNDAVTFVNEWEKVKL